MINHIGLTNDDKIALTLCILWSHLSSSVSYYYFYREDRGDKWFWFSDFENCFWIFELKWSIGAPKRNWSKSIMTIGRKLENALQKSLNVRGFSRWNAGLFTFFWCISSFSFRKVYHLSILNLPLCIRPELLAFYYSSSYRIGEKADGESLSLLIVLSFLFIDGSLSLLRELYFLLKDGSFSIDGILYCLSF